MAPIKNPNVDAALRECRNSLVKSDIELNKLLDNILVSSSKKDMDSLLQISRKLFTDSERELDVRAAGVTSPNSAFLFVLVYGIPGKPLEWS